MGPYQWNIHFQFQWKRGSNWVKYAQDDSINYSQTETRRGMGNDGNNEGKELNVAFYCGKHMLNVYEMQQKDKNIKIRAHS